MDFRIWRYNDQTALENLEIHLEHWQQFLDAYERLVVSSSNPKPLQASLRRHLALSGHTIALLEQQRLVVAATFERLLGQARQVARGHQG